MATRVCCVCGYPFVPKTEFSQCAWCAAALPKPPGPAYGPWWGLRHWLWVWFRKPAIALAWVVAVAFLFMPFWADFSGEHIGNEKVPMLPWGPLWAGAVIVLAFCAATGWLLD